ncbi:isocitrate lyase/PEP mutase family protein [Paraburkholderia sp. RL17-347-BIC-D]|uniref:isocitrate lyase/PEP mutase family protein n=1 Tax=Paraburkholderia sp. RL17-347-BIC-D TaxID=3031632 RepID=UPI0038BB6660
MKSGTAKLRQLMTSDIPPVVPLVLDPISAKLAEASGFQALYLGGGALGYLKSVTEANLTVTEMAQAALDIRAACPLPLILDGACGWGEPMHMHRTIAMAEAAGFAAIEIEDQIFPKRVHHHIGIEHVVPIELATQKIEQAVAARQDEDFIIIARTNACITDDLDEALRRAEAYKRAGADMLIVIPTNPEQYRAIGERIDGPLVYMTLEGLESIGMSLTDVGSLGYKLVIDATTPFYARQKVLRLCYEAMAKGLPDPTLGRGYKEELSHVFDAINIQRLIDVEKNTVEK